MVRMMQAPKRLACGSARSAEQGECSSRTLVFPGDVPGRDPTLRKRLPRRLAPGADAQLLVDVGEVALDRRLGEMEGLSYLATGEGTGRQQQDLRLPAGERALPWIVPLLERPPGHEQDHLLLGAFRISGDDGVHRCDQVLHRRVLGEVGASPEAQELAHVGLVGEDGNDDDLRRGREGEQLSQGDLPPHDRHLHIQYHHVWPRAPGEVHGLPSVRGLRDYLDALVGGEHLGHTLAHQGVVVGKEYPYGTTVYRLFTRIKGRRTSALAPPPGSETSPKEPPSNEMRSFIELKPSPSVVPSSVSRPVPWSRTRAVTYLGVIPTSTSIRSEPECATALRTPSLKTM